VTDRDDSRSARSGLQRRDLFATAVGVVGAILSFAAAKGHLPGLGNDATSYVAIADRLAAKGQLGYFLEPKLGLWPPGFPGVLAFFRWAFNLNPAVTALWINALALIPLAWTIRWLLRRCNVDPRLEQAGILVGVLGPATLSQSYMAQTEITFLLLVLWACIAAVRFADTRSWKWLGLSVLAQWAAYFDRYVGLVAIGAVALWLAFEQLSGSALRARIGRAVGYFVAACAVPGVWMLRNISVVGDPFGPRDTPTRTIKTNLVDATTSLGQFLHGFSRYEPMVGMGRLVSLAIAAGVALLAIWLLRNALRNGSPQAGPTTRNGSATNGAAGLLGHLVALLGTVPGLLFIYGMAHWAYMIYSASTIAFDPVNTRYLMPMFVPLLIGGLVLAQRGGLDPAEPATESTLSPRRIVVGATAVLVAVHLLMGLVRVSASYWTDDAQNYNSPKAFRVRDSKVLDRLRATDCQRTQSNEPELTYLAGFEAIRSPRRTKFASSDKLVELEDLQDYVKAGGKACLIWVAENNWRTPDYQWQLPDLERTFRLEPIAADNDVAAYRVLPAS
jgi:hypothetical protein